MGSSKQHPASRGTAPAGGTLPTPAPPPTVEFAATSRVAGAVVYSVSGILLTLVNKVAIQLFPYTCLLVIVQNAMTVLLLLAGSYCFRATLGSLPRITWAVVRRWAPLSGLFVAMLVSSLLALKDVSAVTLVVLRNLTTLLVAVGERRFLHTRLLPQATAALVGMLFGATIYGASDLSFHACGYAWVGANVLASSTYQIYVKALAKDSALTPLGMSYINNMVSIPILALCSLGLGEPVALAGALTEKGPLDGWTLLIVAVTGLLGYALSTSAFLLNKLISATSIMVINNANKFGVILLSELFMERSLSPLSTAGTVIVLVCAYLYSRCPKQRSQGGNLQEQKSLVQESILPLENLDNDSSLQNERGWTTCALVFRSDKRDIPEGKGGSQGDGANAERRQRRAMTLSVVASGILTVYILLSNGLDNVASGAHTAAIVFADSLLSEGSTSEESRTGKSITASIRTRGDHGPPGSSLDIRKPLPSKSFTNMTIWSTDLHIGPIADVKHLMHLFGVHVIDKSLSGHCGQMGTCAKDLEVLDAHNSIDFGTNGEDPGPLSRKLFDVYKENAEFKRVNTVICMLPLTTCQVYLPLNRSIIMIAVVRYERGQETLDQWTRFNKVLEKIASKGRHFIGANSRYDAEYIKYFTGIPAVYVPSHCGYISARYNPTRPEILLGRSHVPGNSGSVWGHALEQIEAAQAQNTSYLGSNAHPKVVGLDDMYPGHYSYDQIAAHPAIIHFPYTVSVMSFFEHYRMGIPLFVPSIDFMVELHLAYNVLSERTWERLRTGRVPNGSVLAKHPSYPVDYDPNDDVNPEAIRYWLQFADFYVLPHVQLFSSFDDLTYKLVTTDFAEVSRHMQQFNVRQEAYLLDLWQTILERTDTGPPVTPSHYEAVAAEYGMS